MFGIVALAVDQIIRVVDLRTAHALTKPRLPGAAGKNRFGQPFCKRLTLKPIISSG